MASEQLVEVVRGNLVESIHNGHIAVVDYKGRLLASKGDVEKVIFARSSMKPLQAIPIIETGASETFHFTDADLSLACASHNGEAQHTDRVQALLEQMKLEVNDLQCGTHPPRWRAADELLMQKGVPITPIYNNCSGKHSGMLATALQMNESIEDYYLPEHPVQQRILQVVHELTETPIDDIEIGIDGCGVPVHGVPIKNLAHAFAKMAKPVDENEVRRAAIEKVTHAMMSAPEMVGGTKRFCTDFMRAEKGRMFGKVGAEGVYCIGDIETGIGIALKIEDGNARATSAVALAVLEQMDLLTDKVKEQLADYYRPTLKNARDEEIGCIRPSFVLEK